MENKKRLFIVTLEPIEKRYTKQWYETWKPTFKKYFDVVKYIDGKVISDKIEKGRFLDVNQTNMWKAVQVEKIAELFHKKKVHEHDIFLFADGWHFGITALRYMSQLNNIPIKIFAYWHAGTYDPADFISQAGLNNWAKHNEIGWFKACDGHFVATKFHKSLILKRLNKENVYFKTTKIHVVGFPMDWNNIIEKELGKNYKIPEKENKIVFPHRMDKEKSPDVFDYISKQFPEYKFIKTLEVTKNKKEYYTLLSKAKVSFSASIQETFGIGTVEAMMLGCLPLVPRRLAYTELYDGLFMYSTFLVARKKIKSFMEKPELYQKILKINQNKIINSSKKSFSCMANIMRKSK